MKLEKLIIMHNTFMPLSRSLIKLPFSLSPLSSWHIVMLAFLLIQQQESENDLLRIDDIAEIDASTSSEINSKFTMYLREGDSEKRREQFYCKELGELYYLFTLYPNTHTHTKGDPFLSIFLSLLLIACVLTQDLRWRNYAMDIR